ncbi:membrane protein insertase YidC [Streptomyces sp. N2-109]|uniref:Membrane protein insertase YidC n=1 Tax=Streptomyces gossypii TaxID=2883101 RepID=A0ABT2JV41_9ACTN|nr:membrane protein insertase YidC [Streptomyces gossypii]MCT2591220.1 membrane protein insertase YidC [Streptomyces gossypii]
MSSSSSFFDGAASLVMSLSESLDPVFHAQATAVAIVLCTMLVRLALHPLARAAARGEGVRAELAPQLAKLRHRHGSDPERMRRAAAELYTGRGVSPVAGCLPMLLQLPVFFVMYHLFTTDGELLGQQLFGTPLGGRWADALGDGGVFGAQGLVYAGLFAVIGAVAVWTYQQARRSAAQASAAQASTGRTQDVPAAPGAAAMARWLPLLSFGTLITAAVVPLAAGLYLVTTTSWTAVERALLQPLRRPSR